MDKDYKKHLKLRRIIKECTEQLDELGIKHGEVMLSLVKKNSNSIYGYCSATTLNKNWYAIYVSDFLFNDNIPERAIKETVMHELLHTCPNACNHGKEWTALANKVNKAYGYNIKRQTSYSEYGIQTESLPYKYKFVCENCGAEVLKFRDCKFVKNYQKYRCRRCGGDFVKVKQR